APRLPGPCCAVPEDVAGQPPTALVRPEMASAKNRLKTRWASRRRPPTPRWSTCARGADAICKARERTAKGPRRQKGPARKCASLVASDADAPSAQEWIG